MEVGIIGASGYTGGELLRLLHRHPDLNVGWVTSNRFAGKQVGLVHPNLRKQVDLRFEPHDAARGCDLLFTAVPHGKAMAKMRGWMGLADRVVDLSADFRLRDPAAYPVWYGHEHADAALLEQAVYGIPELHRQEMRRARLISGAGCLATASILGLHPLFAAGVVDTDHVVVDAKVGSSAAGAEVSLSTHHPERSHTVRPYAATGHRHTAEMEQELARDGQRPGISFSAHAVELVRGILATGHVWLKPEFVDWTDKEVWKLYRERYREEPFVRIVKERLGIHRYPDPKVLTGSNFADVGFERDPRSRRVVVLSALDNLVKGAAGQAIQNANITLGLEETAGLGEIGFHPI